jgi:low affinity Fe/Cu permease
MKRRKAHPASGSRRARPAPEPSVPLGESPNCAWTERLAQVITQFAGSTVAFIGALLVVIVWAAVGPLFGYGENWQLVINTGTTIVTFLMVFLIQRAQNKDSLAVHLKLNELIAALQGASNRLVTAEDLSEDELELLRRHYRRLRRTMRGRDLLTAHSVDEHNPGTEPRT